MSAGALPGRKVVEIRPSRGLFDLDLGSVWRYRELWSILVQRDIKVRYRQASLGIGWAVLQPLFTVLIGTVIFGHFAKLSSEGFPYPLFCLAGTLPWTYFQEAARRSSVGLVADSELVRKVYFPRFILPVSSVTGPLVDSAINLVILLAMMMFYGVMPTWRFLFVPVFMAIGGLIALSVGLWLGPINAKFRDIMHTVPFLLQVWMYGTPVFYSITIVKAKWLPFYSLNPMVGVVQGFRWAVLGKTSYDPVSIWVSISAIVVLLFGGLLWFRNRERSFADII